MSKLASRLLCLALCSAALSGCWAPGSGTYCQIGPKYGSRCYSQMDLHPPGAAPINPSDDPKR